MTGVLAEPLKLPNGTVLRNRLAKAALSESLGNKEQAPTKELLRVYERWAQSGAGLLITGNVMIDRHALGEFGNVAVEDERHLEALSQWANISKSGGAHVWVQLNHPGRQAARGLNETAFAPSAVMVKGAPGIYAKPRELTSAQIEDIIKRFVESARIVTKAGFTGVQVHSAHGYLLSQFLSPLTNQRTDEWGGSPENRRRILIEIVRAVRVELGDQIPLAVKLNSADFQKGGMSEDESLEVVLALAAENIDLLEISGGNYEATAFVGAHLQDEIKESTRKREAYFLDYAERVRAAVPSLPLMVTGGFRSKAAMEQAISAGSADVIGLGRPMIMEPDLPKKILAGQDRAGDVHIRRWHIKHLEGMGELLWYSVQLRRLGQGHEPDPNRHPIQNIGPYLQSMALFGKAKRGF